MQLFLIISKLEKEEIRLEERKALSRLALHLVLLSQGVPFIHAGQERYRTKGSKKTPITCQIVSTNWTGHPFQNAKKKLLFLKIDCLSEITATPSFEKRARDSRLL